MSLDVLLVEDSPGDVRLMREAFRDTNEGVQLHVASDGVEALAFLRKPALPDALDAIIGSINDFWLKKAKFPMAAMGA